MEIIVCFFLSQALVFFFLSTKYASTSPLLPFLPSYPTEDNLDSNSLYSVLSIKKN